MDDHGTLCDSNGAPTVYKGIGDSEGPSVPLMEAQVWPEDMLMVNVRRNGVIVKIPPPPGIKCDAESFVERIERSAANRFRALPCEGNHGEVLPCPACGAAL
jgi:hypothetical protein